MSQIYAHVGESNSTAGVRETKEASRNPYLQCGVLSPSMRLRLLELDQKTGEVSHVLYVFWLIWLVVEPPYPSEKYESVGMMKFPIYGKIKFMFQTTIHLYVFRISHCLKNVSIHVFNLEIVSHFLKLTNQLDE